MALGEPSGNVDNIGSDQMQSRCGGSVGVKVALFVSRCDGSFNHVLLSRMTFDFVKGNTMGTFASDELEQKPFEIAIWLQIPRLS